MEVLAMFAVCFWFCNMVIFTFERWGGSTFDTKALLRLIGIFVPPIGVIMCFTKMEV